MFFIDDSPRMETKEVAHEGQRTFSHTASVVSLN